jgi:hypothetical protein
VSSGDAIEAGSLDDLHFEESFAGRAVEEDLVPVRLPDCGESDRARPVQTKVNPTRLAVPVKDPFRHAECPEFELIVLTKGLVDEIAKLSDVAKLQKTFYHLG